MGITRRGLAAWPLGWGLGATGVARAQGADPHAWLEEVEGVRALEWVNARNAEALALVEAQPDFGRRRSETLASLSNQANISFPSRAGAWIYNFYRNARQPHGIWRRTTLEEYAKERPSWTVLLNLDNLAREESRNLVFSSVAVHVASDRALVFLSSGGEDRIEFREFDLASRSFVAGGFEAPPAKLGVAWFGPDELLISTESGPGSLTASGYPLAVRRWKRGTPMLDAPLLLRGQPSDVAVWPGYAGRDGLPPVALLRRQISFSDNERHLLLADGSLTRLDLPADSDAWIERDWLMIALRTSWTAGGQTFSEGSLLAIALAQAARPAREVHVLFEGRARRRQIRTAAVKDGFVTAFSENLRPALSFARWDGKAFTVTPLPAPATGMASVRADQPETGNRFWLTTEAPLTPQALTLVDATAAVPAPAPMKKQVPAFKPEGMVVRQFEARSADGTLVPYTVVGADQPAASAPTLLYGYGGFGISVDLDYQRMPGINWLQYGGTYVMAHIRGGGEFGTAWTLAAKGPRRQKGFDDFIAVAQDLVARGIARPRQLGIYGASNGGVLVTTVMVQRPELFGAVVSRVPLTDMLGFHKLFAGASWTEEYGNPDVAADREVLARYSPYQNAKALASGTAYPPILFIGNRNDDRVHPAHARKMVAQLRALGHAKTWLYEERSGGHSGRTDPQIHAQREALVYSFMAQQLAVTA
ncbi:MAG: prolyl oligopeptidase family serine peptidase [Ramlibacter sp.]